MRVPWVPLWDRTSFRRGEPSNKVAVQEGCRLQGSLAMQENPETSGSLPLFLPIQNPDYAAVSADLSVGANAGDRRAPRPMATMAEIRTVLPP